MCEPSVLVVMYSNEANSLAILRRALRSLESAPSFEGLRPNSAACAGSTDTRNDTVKTTANLVELLTVCLFFKGQKCLGNGVRGHNQQAPGHPHRIRWLYIEVRHPDGVRAKIPSRLKQLYLSGRGD